jgi:hypothetical protein
LSKRGSPIDDKKLQAKLEKQRAKWRRQKNNQRSGAWFAAVSVLHFDYFTRCLIDDGLLVDAPDDGSRQAKINKAVDRLLREFGDRFPLFPNPQFSPADHWMGRAPRMPMDREGNVDVKFDADIVNRLVGFRPEIAPLRDNKTVLRQAASEWLWRWYQPTATTAL